MVANFHGSFDHWLNFRPAKNSFGEGELKVRVPKGQAKILTFVELWHSFSFGHNFNTIRSLAENLSGSWAVGQEEAVFVPCAFSTKQTPPESWTKDMCTKSSCARVCIQWPSCQKSWGQMLPKKRTFSFVLTAPAAKIHLVNTCSLVYTFFQQPAHSKRPVE